MSRFWRWFHITDGNRLTDLTVWLVLLTPLIVYPGISEPFSFGRFVMFMFEVALLCLGVIWLPRPDVKRRWWRSPIFILLTTWLVVSVVAGLLGVNPTRSWWGTVNRATGEIFFVGLWLLISGLAIVVQRPGSWLKIFSVMSTAGGLTGLYIILQPLGLPFMPPFLGGRASGIMGNPIFAGQLLLITIFLTIYFVLCANAGRIRTFYILNLLVQLMALMMTASRGPIAGLIAGLVIMSIIGVTLMSRSQLRRYWRWWLGTGVVVIASLGGLAYWLFPQVARLWTLGESFRSRLVIWQVAWQAFIDRPILGYGPENARYAMAHFYQSGLGDISLAETVADRMHSIVFDQLIEHGALGGLVMLLLFICLGWFLIRRLIGFYRAQNHRYAVLILSLMGLLSGYGVASLTSFDVVSTFIYLAVLGAALMFWLAPEEPTTFRAGLIRWLAAGLAVTLLVFNYRYLLPAWKIGVRVRLASWAASVNNYRLANSWYNKAQVTVENPYRWSYVWQYPQFARRYAGLLFDDNQPEKAAEVAADGVRVLSNIERREPDRIGLFVDYPTLFAIWAVASGDARYWDSAHQSFTRLSEAFPNHEYLYLIWARTLMIGKKYAEADQVLTSLSQRPTPPRELDLWRGILAIYLHKSPPIAVGLLNSASNNNIIFVAGNEGVLRDIVAFLFRCRQWSIAAYYQEVLVKLVANDVQEHSNLAVIYKELGRWDDAVKEAKIIIALDHSQYAATQKFLQSIGRSL